MQQSFFELVTYMTILTGSLEDDEEYDEERGGGGSQARLRARA